MGGRVAGGRDRDYKLVALGFAEALARRDYFTAWAMTSKLNTKSFEFCRNGIWRT